MAATNMTTTTTTSSYFPIDVLIIMFSLLPSKCLLRFRCVCKSWRDLINDPKFIEFHRNQNKNDHILTICRSNNVPKSALYLCCDKTFMERTRARLELPFLKFYTNPLWLRKFSVAGCSNGLVLICFYGVERTFTKRKKTLKYRHEKPLDTEIILWNPSIQKWKVLPYSECLPNSNILAFGFVPRVNDYKVVKIINCSDGGNHVAKPEIYSLSTNSWKPIEVVVGCALIDKEVKQVVNGVVIFLAVDKNANYKCILSFDMADEVFTKVRIPQLSDFTLYPMMSGEELLLFGIYCDLCTSAAYIWGIKENYDGAAAEYSLTELFTADKDVQPLGFLRNGELVWRYKVREGNMHGSLGSYDPILRQVKDVDTDFSWMVYALFHYRESLMLLNEGD